MGIDIHVLNFLRYANTKRPMGATITIGRQLLHVIEPKVKELVGAGPGYANQKFCEGLLLEYFGATKVDSVDNSDYEQATHIHDMNEPVPEAMRGGYDTVLDVGCLEHIFNAPQAFKNCSMLCMPGGQIIHILPANNFCGHGFWQFSPELFFSLYSDANGYRDTEVFLASLSDLSRWFKVRRPDDGKRVNVTSTGEVYVLARTTLHRADFSHLRVQQSDYVYVWGNSGLQSTEPHPEASGIKERLKQIPFLYKVLSPAYHYYLRSRTETGLNDRNPGLVAVSAGVPN